MRKELDSILQNVKLAYKESVLIENDIIQDILLTVLTDVKMLEDKISITKLRPGLKVKKTLEDNQYTSRNRVSIEEQQSYDINVIAYVFSEYEHTALFPNKNQTESVTVISNLMSVKYKTFTNRRDRFDRYTHSKRAGWDENLPNGLQVVFNELKGLSKDVVIDKAKQILQKYS